MLVPARGGIGGIGRRGQSPTGAGGVNDERRNRGTDAWQAADRRAQPPLPRPEQLPVRGPSGVPGGAAGARLRGGRAAAHDQLRAGTPARERSRPRGQHQGERLARHRPDPGPAHGDGAVPRGRREPAGGDAQVPAAPVRRGRHRSREARPRSVCRAAGHSVSGNGRAKPPRDDGASPHLRQAALARDQPRPGDGAAASALRERCAGRLRGPRRQQARVQPVGENAGLGEGL